MTVTDIGRLVASLESLRLEVVQLEDGVHEVSRVAVHEVANRLNVLALQTATMRAKLDAALAEVRGSVAGG